MFYGRVILLYLVLLYEVSSCVYMYCLRCSIIGLAAYYAWARTKHFGCHSVIGLAAYYAWARTKHFGCHSVITLAAAGE